MVLQSASSIFCDLSTNRKNPSFSSISNSSQSYFCPCINTTTCRRKRERAIVLRNVRWVLLQAQGCIKGRNAQHQIRPATQRGAKNIILKQFSDEENLDYVSSSSSQGIGVSDDNNNNINNNSNTSSSNYYSSSFGQDPIVDKLRTQLGVIHPIPSPPINRNVFGLFAFFFFVGVVFDKLVSSRKRNAYTISGDEKGGSRPQLPTSLSMFLEKDLQRKESVEWVNMVLGKLWKVYRVGIENWIIGVLQPVIDNLKKPDYVERVEIKQFSLGNEPLSVRSVERKTSRRVNDLQYQIGLRYTGGARMLLLLSLKFGILPIAVPVGVRDFDIDGELWVKLRLIPTEPWVGSVSWAFVSLPKIKFELSPFRVFNLMAIPVLSMFLKKLLTEDLPRLFVRPKKNVVNFQKGKATGPVTNDSKAGEVKEGNTNFAGELSVTLLDARQLSYIFYGKTDPYVILRVGDQVIRSKRNSQTTVIGPPGEPIWNQDFHMLVANPKKDKLSIVVKDSLGFADLTVGTAEVDLGPLKDTVPADRIVVLRGGWSLFGKGSCGEILVRLTYKAYVEDEEDEKVPMEDAKKVTKVEDEEEGYLIEQSDKESSFVDVLAALLVSEEFRGIVTSETLNNNNITKSIDEDENGVDSSESSEETKVPTITSTSTSIESGGSRSTTLFWLALITSISVIVAINMGGSSLFNP